MNNDRKIFSGNRAEDHERKTDPEVGKAIEKGKTDPEVGKAIEKWKTNPEAGKAIEKGKTNPGNGKAIEKGKANPGNGKAGGMRRPEPKAGKVRELRKAAHLSQSQLAERAGVCLRTIKKLEKEGCANCRYDTMKKVAGVFGLKAGDLEERDDTEESVRSGAEDDRHVTDLAGSMGTWQESDRSGAEDCRHETNLAGSMGTWRRGPAACAAGDSAIPQDEKQWNGSITLNVRSLPDGRIQVSGYLSRSADSPEPHPFDQS